MEDFWILVADDDDDDYFIVKDAFSLATACKLERAVDGGQLLTRLNQLQGSDQKFPDLILMDINMPKIDGIKALGLIKSSPHFSSIPVIMYSTAANKSQQKQCSMLGAHGYSVKASHYKDVVSFARNVLEFLAKFKASPLAPFVNKSGPIGHQE